MRPKHFRDLLIWKRAMELARSVYRLTQELPKQEMFGLTNQMRRAAVSVPSNIAEGQGRLSDRAFVVFLGHARGSLFELETQLELAASLGYIEAAESEQSIRDCNELARMLNGLLNTLKKDERLRD